LDLKDERLVASRRSWGGNSRSRIVGAQEPLLATVRRQKLAWSGHVMRHDTLSKTILQGTVDGGRRQGRQRQSGSDNIKDWTEMIFPDLLSMAANRTARRNTSASSAIRSPRRLQKRVCTRYCLLTIHDWGAWSCILNIQVTGHVVVVGSQGLGNRCRMQDAVHLRSSRDPVKDVTSDMGRLNNRLRKTEDGKDVNHLGCGHQR